MKLLEDALIEYYGERCSDFAEGCPCCEAWAELDDLKESKRNLKEVKDLVKDWRDGDSADHYNILRDVSLLLKMDKYNEIS